MALWTIADLNEARASLNDGDRAVFDRLYRFDISSGALQVPKPMVPWVEETYGDVATVEEQEVVKITNLWSLQTSLFNPFRAMRPQKESDSDSLADEIYGDGPDPFDEPEINTTEDPFGRVRGEHCLTAGNLAKSDANHGVIIFNEHNPWMVTEDAFWDAIQVADRWFSQCHAQRASAVYPLLIWNCLWKSGASIKHAHMQLLMTGSMHYGEIERLRRVTVDYRQQHERGYFDDLYDVHSALGLGRRVQGGRAVAHLTPLRAGDVMLFAEEMTEAFARSIYRVIRMLNEQHKVTSFNMVVIPQPLAQTEESWTDMPVLVRIVDRGNPLHRTIDTGALELFAANVISSDPFELGRSLSEIDFQ